METIKKIVAFCVFITFTSCFENDIEIIDNEINSTLHKNSALSILISSVTSHDASFDDRIDDSGCFSLIFPYDLLINGEHITILNIEDINLIHEEDEIEILFPVNILFADYDTKVLQNESQFNTVYASCQNGELFNFHIGCAEFVYPFSFAKYNSVIRNFDRVNMNSKQEIFQFLANLKDDDIYRINFPLNIILFDTEYFTVQNNQILTNHFVDASLVCD
ncbi:MAG: hypothetical protein H0X63_01535 [Flavobacteriales bacterium]|nr:hypothetical protein [Flavobacteriales bacterium]